MRSPWRFLRACWAWIVEYRVLRRQHCRRFLCAAWARAEFRKVWRVSALVLLFAPFLSAHYTRAQETSSGIARSADSAARAGTVRVKANRPALPAPVAKKKQRRVLDWRLVLAVAGHAAAFSYDVETTAAALRRCAGCVESSLFASGPRPSRGSMYKRGVFYIGGVGVLSYVIKRAMQRAGLSPNAPLWAVPQIVLTPAHIAAGKHNAAIRSDRRNGIICPANAPYNSAGGCV